jgi:hypothetical protein
MVLSKLWLGQQNAAIIECWSLCEKYRYFLWGPDALRLSLWTLCPRGAVDGKQSFLSKSSS